MPGFHQTNQKGTAGIELAIVLPLLLLMIFGVIEFGILFYNKQVITNASREGVRAGITYTDIAAVRQIVRDYCRNELIGLSDPVTITDSNITITPPDGQNDLTVTVSFDYPLFFAPLIGIDQATLIASTVMRMEPI
jgi:Flp pilus assembly protein TadG